VTGRPGLVLVAAVAFALTGCDAAAGAFRLDGDERPAGAEAVPADRLVLHVMNGTALAVAVAVNGAALAVVPPRDGAQWPAAQLPALPWLVEARTVAGRLLTTMTVRPGDVWTVDVPGKAAFGGSFARIDLSCGRLDLWAAMFQPSGPAPGPGQLGDCAP